MTENEIKVTEIDALGDQIFALESIIDEEERITGEKKKELEALKAKALAHFKILDKEKYFLKGRGTLFIHHRFSVTTPKGDDKVTFGQYLKDKGHFDEMWTVNSQTLNSYFQKENEIALEAGNVAFTMPGIPEPKLIETLRTRKEK